jgi:hypothetical protein
MEPTSRTSNFRSVSEPFRPVIGQAINFCQRRKTSAGMIVGRIRDECASPRQGLVRSFNRR